MIGRGARVAAALLGVVAIAGSVSLRPHGAGASSGSATRSWMVSSGAIGLIDGYTGTATLTTSAFDVSTTEELGQVASGWVTQRTVTFTAYGPASSPRSLLYALAHKRVPAGTRYVLYDDEYWSLTPQDEQRDPGAYMADFVAAAHAAGYRAILAPAIDLARGMSCYKQGDPAAVNYVSNCSIPRLAGEARPDIYDVQAQLYETDTSLAAGCNCYAWLVLESVLEARRASPVGTAMLSVLAGLTTNKGGKVTTAQVLYTDTKNTTPLDAAAAVDGYWLNLPERSGACPQCVPGGAPQVAVGYLHLLGYQG